MDYYPTLIDHLKYKFPILGHKLNVKFSKRDKFWSHWINIAKKKAEKSDEKSIFFLIL